jgi:hypothetical protein
MANPLAIALALYGGYKGYKAGKQRGGGLGGIIGGILGAAGGYYGGQGIGSALNMQNVAGTQGFTNAMMTPFTSGQAATSAMAADPNQLSLAQIGAEQQAAANLGGSQGILGSVGQFAKKYPGATLGAAVGLGSLASGMFQPEPYKRALFTYNLNYPDLYRNRSFYVQDPNTGQTVKQDQLAYIPEENVGTTERFGPYAMDVKTMYTGGLVDIVQKFNAGGMPTKMTHDEKDVNNYKRVNGAIMDHTSGANKDEDTVLAQLADGEFVTRTDGILGAGILNGANPNDMKEMRKKGADFFYEQQAKMKRLYDLFHGKKKTIN